MSNSKDEHRVVKIDYSVLKEFLDIVIHNDGYCNYMEYGEWSCHTFPRELIDKAYNILNNS